MVINTKLLVCTAINMKVLKRPRKVSRNYEEKQFGAGQETKELVSVSG